MAAPILTSLSNVSAASRAALPALVDGPQAAPSASRAGASAPVEHFVVVRDGAWAGGSWSAGEVVVCRGEARDGDVVVLVARGHGRPRLGRVVGGELFGDAGERCHPARWRVAGRCVATWTQQRGGWVCVLADGGDAHRDDVVVERAPAAQPQLGLFETRRREVAA